MRTFACTNTRAFWLSAMLLITAGALGQSASFFPGDNINWSTFDQGQDCSIKESMTRLIRSENDWVAYYKQLTGQPGASAPRDVNWREEQLVAIHLGSRPSSGYQVYVKTVSKGRAGEITVTYVEDKPLRSQVGLTVMTSPYVIIRMPRRSESLRFVKAADFKRGNEGLSCCGCSCPCCRSHHGG